MTVERRTYSFTIRHANGELNLLVGEFVKIMRERFAREDIYASCLTCIHVADAPSGQTFCKKYQQFPPLHVLVNSCSEGYEDNQDIPM